VADCMDRLSNLTSALVFCRSAYSSRWDIISSRSILSNFEGFVQGSMSVSIKRRNRSGRGALTFHAGRFEENYTTIEQRPARALSMAPGLLFKSSAVLCNGGSLL
jgi:hypothetical protein